jgi:glycosyltransferase involved in cell wall biosynthesis
MDRDRMTENRIPCTVGVLTYNSGATLRRSLASLASFEDIIVCDGGSTDETLAIAEEYGARIITQDPAYRHPNGTLADYAGVRNQCVEAGRHDWFFYIDSDEEATPELVASIRNVVEEAAPQNLVYNISPRIVLNGRRIEHSSNYPGWQKRFFNRATGARFRKPVHERLGYDENQYPAGYLAGHWLYFITGASDAEKREKYARMEARAQIEKGIAGRLYVVWRKMRTVARILVVAAYHALRYPRTSMPFSLEMRRVRYQMRVAQLVIAPIL